MKLVSIYGGLAGKIAHEEALQKAKEDYERVVKEINEEVENEAQGYSIQHPEKEVYININGQRICYKNGFKVVN